jgi:hypothetical protein
VVASPLRDEAMQLKHRQNVQLLLAHNPNYFGNLPELDIPPVIELTNDTFFEELVRVGYDDGVLSATIELKRPVGYGPGSTEWVRFHVSGNGGASWVDAGLASFTAADLTGPVSHTVAHRLPTPVPGTRVRAILSWQLVPVPGQPGWQPVWGNVIEHHLPLRPAPQEHGAPRRRNRPPWRPYGGGGVGTPVTDASALRPDARLCAGP